MKTYLLPLRSTGPAVILAAEVSKKLILISYRQGNCHNFILLIRIVLTFSLINYLL